MTVLSKTTLARKIVLGLSAIVISSMAHGDTVEAKTNIDTQLTMLQEKMTTNPVAFDMSVSRHLLEPGKIGLMKLAASSSIKRRTSTTRLKRATRVSPSGRRAVFSPGSNGGSQGPATINCDNESSEECQKIVVCTPNCSTEQMQGGDCC